MQRVWTRAKQSAWECQVERNELEEKFEKFGRVVDIWVARQPPGFAFVTMDDENEANEAVKELDGSKVAGERIRVEVSKGGEPRRGPPPRRGGSRSMRFCIKHE
ncbi:rsp-6 [Symbiodinium pilosum]|uniref:Rsp-6 protein n=1 Tax=Symbiodinium pilosum TaxID=2952 RepID=A0A812MSK5_SYMPI|nr:rsp-6 [Symbiodinium pilosum]